MNEFDTHLTYDEILAIHSKAIVCGLQDRRELLFVGIPRLYISTLQTDTTPATQLMLDLSSMNQVPSIQQGLVPLERWLRNAAYHSAVRTDLQAFFREKADSIAETTMLAAQQSPLASPLSQIASIQEKIIHVDDKLPIDFLFKAGQAAKSVARLLVPRYDGGQLQTFPLSTEEMIYLGTGWVIGPRHVITNHHVVNARDDNETDADVTDFDLQGRSTRVQFDYDAASSNGEIFEVEGVQAFDKSLDFTVLKLSEEINRPALRLWDQTLQFSSSEGPAVNVVQHPGGAPKQIAIRNNLVAKLTDNDLAYFTDTEGGSSGAPVCTDEWYVIALHKASTRALGKFEFQGKTTAWVNVGTRIDKLLEHIRSKHRQLWDEISPAIAEKESHV